MNYEEKLDFILKRLCEVNAFYLDEISVCDYLKPYVSQNEFREYKLRLIADGFYGKKLMTTLWELTRHLTQINHTNTVLLPKANI